ncbi:MAG: MFS transporter [Rhodospirillaceae bacterium]
MSEPSHFGRIAAAFRQPNYRIFQTGSVVSLIGIWTHRVASGWLTWELTGSGAWLGLMAFADLFPSFLLTPFGGVLADRMDRRKMFFITQAIQMAIAAMIATLAVTGTIDIWSLFALTLANGLVTAVNTGVRLTMVPNLVAREHLTAAVALDATLFNLARFVGPAIAGVIILKLGVSAAFVFNALSFTAFLFVLTRIRFVRNEVPARPTGSVLSQFVDGVRYALRHPGIAPMLLALVAAAIGLKPYIELLAGFADVVFHRGPEALSMMMSGTGVGAVVGAVWLAQRGMVTGLALITVCGLVIGGAGLLVFTATDMFWLAVPMTLVVGFAMQICGTSTQTLMQASVEGPMRGRVMSLYGMIFRGAPAAGALAMGTLSEHFGLRAPVAAGGILCLAIALYTLPRLPRIRAAIEASTKPT